MGTYMQLLAAGYIVMKHSTVILMSMLVIISLNISFTLPRTVYTELEDTDYPGLGTIYYPIFVNQESSHLDSLPLPPSPPKNRRGAPPPPSRRRRRMFIQAPPVF